MANPSPLALKPPELSMSDHLAERHFEQISRLVEQHTGIKLPPSKRLMVEGRLMRRVRALGLDGLAQYGEAMFNKGLLESEFQNLVDSVTTNKTDFFREPQQFDLLQERLIDELRHIPERHGKPLKFWSAAASIGAEAYTLAMVAADALGTRGFEVLGTDISESVLEFARMAVYPSAMIDPIPQEARQSYLLLPRDPQRQEFRIVPELRRLVRFESQNLMDETYARPRDFDVIFCRNVLIYFTEDAFDRTVRALAGRLKPGGTLVLSATEPILRPVAELATIRARDAFFYQRVDPAVPPKRVAPAAPPLSRPVPPAMVLRSAPIPAPAPSLASGPVVPRTDPRDEADEQFQLVLGWAAAGEPDTATEQGLRRALYLDPHLAQARFLLAMLLEQRGGRADAATEYRRALAALQEGKARATQFFLNNERLKGACEAALARLGFLRR